MSEENSPPASTEAAPEPGLTGQQIGEAIVAIQKCLTAVAKRLETVEKYVSELPTPAKTYYKPEGYDDYMNLKENFDELYKRVGELEK